VATRLGGDTFRGELTKGQNVHLPFSTLFTSRLVYNIDDGALSGSPIGAKVGLMNLTNGTE